MSKFIITGGRRLKGELCPQGAKNEALQVICACLLTKEEVTISNVPEILDVIKLIELLQGMGVRVAHPEHGTYTFQASDIDFHYFETEDFYNKAVSLRGSIMILGPLLAVYGFGVIPKPGGDKIGRRRLDTHFLGFEKLGATFDCVAATCSWTRLPSPARRTSSWLPSLPRVSRPYIMPPANLISSNFA